MRLSLPLPPADFEPQAGAAVAAGGGSVGLGKGLEEPSLLQFRYADPGVPNLEAYHRRAVRLFAKAGVHDHFAFLGELHGVAEQVREDLSYPTRVPSHGRWHVVIDGAREFETFCVGPFGEGSGCALDTPSISSREPGNCVRSRSWEVLSRASSLVQPYIFSAPRFQKEILPAMSRAMIVS
jgi:hypothetical protein